MNKFRLYALEAHSRLLYFFRRSVFHVVWPLVDSWCSLLVDCCRLFAGSQIASGLDKCKRPEKLLIIYQFEACPFCRKVREVLSVLAIDHIVNPCPRETLKQSGSCMNSRYRPEVMQLGGRLSFPFLVDPNTEQKLYESDDIIKYLWKEYGAQAKPPMLYTLAQCPKYRSLTMTLISILRPHGDMGLLRAVSHKPQKPLELYGYDSSSSSRRIREVLDTLELSYLYHEIPYGATEKRRRLLEEYQKDLFFFKLRHSLCLPKIPFFIDPNTKVQLSSAGETIKYLKKTYQTAPIPGETWMDYGVLDAMKTK